MRASLAVFGGLLIILGLVWIGQGLGFVKGSFMTGVGMWAWIGGVAALLGAALAVVALRRPARR
jgi:drug/metabolite transporter superfamily protein YnfA